MPTISTVGTGGGRDFSSLGAWESFADGEANADQWAECYDDGGGSLGNFTLAGWVATPDASNYPRIYAAPGHETDGTPTGGVQVGRASTGVNYTRFEGLRFEETGSNIIQLNLTGSFYQIDNCFFHATTGGAGTMQKSIRSASNTQDVTITNTIFYDGATTTGTAQICVEFQHGAGENLNLIMRHCTLVNNGHWSNGIFANAHPTHTNYDILCENIAVSGFTVDFDLADAHIDTVTLNNCASTDSTADNFLGSDNLVDQVAADMFTDPSNGDVTLKDGSNLIDAGKDLTGTIPTDIVGDSWIVSDIGAFAHGTAVVIGDDGYVYITDRSNIPNSIKVNGICYGFDARVAEAGQAVSNAENEYESCDICQQGNS